MSNGIKKASDEKNQVPAFGARQTVLPDPSSDDLPEIAEEMPLDGQDPIKRPQIEVLPAVKAVTLLVWSQAAEETQVDVGVVAGDVDKSVMEDIVVPVPDIGTSAD